MVVDKSKDYSNAVTHVDDELVEIIDVEKVLAEITGVNYDLSSALREQADAAA